MIARSGMFGGAGGLHHKRTGVVLLCLLFLVATIVWGQVEQGVIMGYVKDTSDAAIPGAAVTITNVDTNISHETTTDAGGYYRSIPLAVGNYTVAVEYAGFKRTVRAGLTLEVQQQALVDLVMEVGAVSEEITVTAATPLLQTSEASQGEVIENRKIVDLPLNGRSYLQLALLTKGANVPASGSRFGGFTAGGLRSDHNNYLLDGMDNNSNQHAGQGRTGQVISPSIDAVQEFKVLTNAYSAEYGRNVGGVVNVVIKSGTNDFHGGAFEFLRNEKLDAKNFFDDPDAENPPYKRNQFGAFIGGPIVRNKTFFFGDYEGTIQRESATTLSTVATPLEKLGDFSQSIYAGSEVSIYDPDSYDPETNTRTPYPNNIMPASSQDSVTSQVISFYPDPNREGVTNNYLSNPLTRADTHKENVKIDHTFSESDSIYGRYSNHYYIKKGDGQLPEPAWGGNDRSTILENRNQAFVVSHTHIFTPTLFNTLKVGWNRFLTNRKPPTETDYNAQLGISGTASWGGLAVFSITGFQNLGNQASTPHISDSQDRQLVNDLSWIRGRHTVKAGANLHFVQSGHLQAYQSQGVFTFNKNFTRQTSNNKGGHPLAHLLTGYPNASQLTTVATGEQRRRLYALYVNDQIRVTDRLTMNVGVRWEYIGPWYEKFNKYANFTPYSSPPGLVLAEDGGIYNRATIRPDYNNFAPRFGIAYRATNRTVIRTAYGIYYGGVTHIGDRYLHCGPPNQVFARFSTDNIHPGVIVEDGFDPGALTDSVTNLQTISQDRRNLAPYSQQWNFTIQHELGGDLSFEIGYAGTKGNRFAAAHGHQHAGPGAGECQLSASDHRALHRGMGPNREPLVRHVPPRVERQLQLPRHDPQHEEAVLQRIELPGQLHLVESHR